MALQKRIDELDAATQVNSTDMFAVAQSGSNEAVRATTSQIAAAVQELNEGGALTELIYATSQGKNLLAQNLTNKGVPTESSETIIQMANKVDNLIILDDAANRKGCIAKSPTHNTSTSGDNYISAARMDILNENLVFCYYGSNILILPRVSTATNFTQWIGNPLDSISFTKTLTRWAHSHSGKKLALYSSTDTTCTVLTINPTTGEITNTTVYQFTGTPYPSSYSGDDCFMDDGVTWLSKDTNTNYYIHVYDVSASTTTQAMSFSVGSYAQNGKMYTIGNKIIYSRPQSSDFSKVYIIPLDYDNGTYTRGAFIESSWPVMFDNTSSYALAITFHAEAKKGFLFCSTKRANSGNPKTSSESVQFGMICFDVDTGEYFYEDNLPVHSAADMNMLWYNNAGTSATYNFNGSTANGYKVPLGMNDFYMETLDQGTKIRIYNTPFMAGLDCDLVNKKFTIQTVDGLGIYQPTSMISNSPYSSWLEAGYFPIWWKNTSNGNLYGSVGISLWRDSNASYSLSHTNGLFGNGKAYLIYSTRTVEGNVYPLMGSLNPSYASALIPAETEITPAVPDEE